LQQTADQSQTVTSGSTPEVGQFVNDVYASVITAGTHLAPTIKVAEAAKVIENSQRDINIAFVWQPFKPLNCFICSIVFFYEFNKQFYGKTLMTVLL
jgi:UDP-N-acetyl-D-galactosamine dehydrogenase